MNRPDETAQAILRRHADDPALRYDVVSGLAHSAGSSEETRRILLSGLDGPASHEAIRSLSGAIDRPEVKEALEKKGGELVAILLGRPAGLPPSMDGWKKVAAGKGDIVDGRVLYEDPAPTGEIILIDAQGKQTKVKNQDIDERQASKLSIMPEKLPERMTRQDFRDLIDFLSGLK